MENAGLWLTPLILLPGVALLILSTSMRYAQIHDEVHRLFEENYEESQAVAAFLLKRAILFRNALFSLYTCVGLFALASLAGLVTKFWASALDEVVIGLTAVGVATLLFAAIQLIKESLLSLEIIKEHWRKFESD